MVGKLLYNKSTIKAIIIYIFSWSKKIYTSSYYYFMFKFISIDKYKIMVNTELIVQKTI
jgi:hypothetical protein